jgi:hypothetical protein
MTGYPIAPVRGWEADGWEAMETYQEAKSRQSNLRAGKAVGLATETIAPGLGAVTTLPEFTDQIKDRLSRAERRKLVDQAFRMLDQVYVHLPLKRAMHGVDPLQQLRLIEHDLKYSPQQSLEDEIDFHARMMRIFTSLRDLHTNYILPSGYQGSFAFLPFMVEEFYERKQLRYLVTRIDQRYLPCDPAFAPGVELLYWNGMPIRRAVQTSGDRAAGSNPEARRARGVEKLTIRPLATTLQPDEEWVIVGYQTPARKTGELRVQWLAKAPDPQPTKRNGEKGADHALSSGLDLEGHEIYRAKKLLFAPDTVERERFL